MNKLEIFNRTVTTVVCYVKLNGFEYTIDHLNRVRLVSYVGSEELTREAKRELNASTVEYIRDNVKSIVNEMETHLLLQSSCSTDSRHAAIELA